MTWKGIDLSGATIRNARFVGARIEDCLFERAELDDWRLWHTEVIDCSFVAADLRGSALAAADESVNGHTLWRSVSFDGANLDAAHFWQGELTRCTFRGAKLRKTRFEYVDFEEVIFEGLLDRVLLEARPADGRPQGVKPMRAVSFADALFRDCQFQGYRCESVVLPEGVLLVKDLRSVVIQATQSTNTADDEIMNRVIDYFSRLVRPTTESGWDYVYFPADLVAIGEDAEAQKTWEMLVSAMKEIGTPTDASARAKPRWNPFRK